MRDKLSMRRRDVLQMGGMAGLGGLALMSGVAPMRSAFAADAPTVKPVTLVNPSANVDFTFDVLMKKLGYFKDLGLDPNVLHVADGSKIIGALVSGSGDICTASGFSNLFPAMENGAKLKIIGGALILPEQAVFSKRPDIKSVKDLVGKTIGTGSPGALIHELMVALLHKHGIDIKSVTFANIGSNADVFKAVVAGTVDAGPSAIDVYDDQAKYGVHSLTDGNLWTEIPEYTYQACYTSDKAIAAKRDVLVRTTAAYVRLYKFIQSPDSRDAFREARASALGKDEPAQADSQWNFFQKYKPYAVNPVLSEERVNYIQSLNVELGVQKKVLPYDQVVDASIAQDAQKLAG